MSDQCRLFDAGPDPFGRMWRVQFRWLQTAISIRHADAVDVKFLITPDGGEQEEKIISLPHPALLSVTSERGRKLSDPLCLRLAALYLRHMIETSEDMDKTLVTLSLKDIDACDQHLHGVTVPGNR
jgi:hypothetical protein